ncbi:MAG: cob(I)yrinic acid a,c-diamide adenosyltransferase [Verrucomicrobiota bacterium]
MTKRGDEGETDLLYGKRVSKLAPRVEALGAIDELNAALGVVRCHGGVKLAEELDRVQEALVGLMGELATLREDWERYEEDGLRRVGVEDVARLEEQGKAIEASGISYEGWARPGQAGVAAAAFLDLARTICRRAERRVLEIRAEEVSPEVRLFLNRLSDWLWLLARREESGGK